MRRFSKITPTQLARICGVSQGTVDRALHDRSGINPETRERILKIARQYDYSPQIQSAGQGNSMLLGVVLFDLYNDFFSKLAMSIVSAAGRCGYSVIFQFSQKNEKKEKEALEYFDYIGVDGIILFSAGSDSQEYQNYLRSIQKPIALVGNKLFDFTYIGIDDQQAMYDLSREIAGQVPTGDILYYAPILKKPLHRDNAQLLRKQGFQKAMEDLGRSYRIVTDVEEISDFGGIVCSTDYYILQVLKHLGHPKELVIGGFDNISTLKMLSTEVVSVEYATDNIAEECINYILGRRFSQKVAHRLVRNTE